MSRQISMTFDVKDPDAIEQDEGASSADRKNIRKFFDFGEYTVVHVLVDPKTGKGTCWLEKP